MIFIANHITMLLLVSLEAIVVVPAAGYLLWGRRYRRRMILGYFTPTAIAQYFDQFWGGNSTYGSLSRDYRFKQDRDPNSAETLEASQRLKEGLRDLYSKRFGWISFAVPLAIFAAILAEDGTLVTNFAAAELSKILDTSGATVAVAAQAAGQDNLSLTVAAIAGAYLWIGLSLIGRVASLTLLPWDLNYYSLRLLISPMMGHAVAVLDKDKGILIAFVITMLPIADILSWLRAGAAKTLNITESPREAADKIVNLPGVDSDIAARFQEQGITTFRQLTEVDPVQLSMRTGFDFAFVVALVDQAIAWGYFGPTLISLRPFGWVGASNIIDTARALGEQATSVQQAALDFCRAKSRLDAAKALLAETPAGHAAYAARDAARAAVQQVVDAAFEALGATQSVALIEEIAGVADFRLKSEGLRNVVRTIGKDSYAKFIRNLMREIATPAEAPPPAPPPTGFAARFAARFVHAARGLGDF